MLHWSWFLCYWKHSLGGDLFRVVLASVWLIISHWLWVRTGKWSLDTPCLLHLYVCILVNQSNPGYPIIPHHHFVLLARAKFSLYKIKKFYLKSILHPKQIHPRGLDAYSGFGFPLESQLANFQYPWCHNVKQWVIGHLARLGIGGQSLHRPSSCVRSRFRKKKGRALNFVKVV